MKTGMNLALWTIHVTEEHYPLLKELKDAGFDGVEVPVFDGDPSHYQKLGQVIADHGLQCTASTAIPDQEHSSISKDPTHRAGAVDYLKWAVDCTAAMGGEILCGPLYQPLALFSGQAPTEQEKQHSAQVMRQAAQHARHANVRLAVEYLNRYECYFLNTLADAANFVRRVNHPAFGTMYDTFHANIEEKDGPAELIQWADQVIHFHVSENDRGTPGSGHIPWEATFQALRGIGYERWITIEAFGRALPDLAAATRVWRDFFPHKEHVYEQGLPFMKRMWEQGGGQGGEG